MAARPSTAAIKTALAREAEALGFDAFAVTTGDDLAVEAERFARFIELGRHGTMGWMAEHAERRSSPKRLWPEVRSVIMLAMNYGPEPDADPLALLDEKSAANISVYARHRDYHDVIKGRLKTLASKLVSQAGGDVKVFVDTAPVLEKPLAGRAGLGWQGKHTNLVSRTHGSWLFLGSIFTTAEIEPDTPETDHCGSCRQCLDICPTAAFPAPYQLDARRCLSYLTIENKGPIPRRFRKAMGNRVYGCDDCLAVCPWNKFASETREAKLAARDDLTAPPLAEFLALDDTAFRARFSGSPIKRIGRDRFLRNCLIAAGNSGDDSLVSTVRAHLDDPHPLVRGAAIWALFELSPKAFATERDRRANCETDADVRDEWTAALSATRTREPA